jgi:electron transfer flavoprotein alpha subunit
LKEKTKDTLTNAKVVVIIGRGVGSEDNIKLLQCFADKIGGVLAATRPVVNNGWMPVDTLIGMSGKKIKPELCVVIGASGATPLVSGIVGAKHIIAINNDMYAPIFDVCDTGLVEDYKEVINHYLSF